MSYASPGNLNTEASMHKIGENVMMPAPAQNQVQTDLQRKQAELQASIEQKQAELRRISEQLVMARLGILPSQPEQQTNVTE